MSNFDHRGGHRKEYLEEAFNLVEEVFWKARGRLRRCSPTQSRRVDCALGARDQPCLWHRISLISIVKCALRFGHLLAVDRSHLLLAGGDICLLKNIRHPRKTRSSNRAQ